jgi:hypothetical protein
MRDRSLCSVPFRSDYGWAAASSSGTMSKFILFIMARMAAGCLSNSVHCAGTICQQTPNLSLSQPQPSSLPSSTSLAQQVSMSACVSQRTVNENASLNVVRGAFVEEGHLLAVESQVHGQQRTDRPGSSLGGTQFIEFAAVGENGKVVATCSALTLNHRKG